MFVPAAYKSMSECPLVLEKQSVTARFFYPFKWESRSSLDDLTCYNKAYKIFPNFFMTSQMYKPMFCTSHKIFSFPNFLVLVLWRLQ